MQQELEEAISKVANEKIIIIGAGRTDTGVHSSAQVFHFDANAKREPYDWCRGVNTITPKGVSVLWFQPVDKTFHARFSAQARRYRYIIFNRNVSPSFLHAKVTWDYRPLVLARMQEAAQLLLGQHDFSAFRAASCQSKSPVRKITKISVQQSGRFIWIDVEADGFLHHMVRNIAGVITAIGAGERPVNWIKEVLQSRDRKQGGMTARPDGLYLTGVDYPHEFDLLPSPEPYGFW